MDNVNDEVEADYAKFAQQVAEAVIHMLRYIPADIAEQIARDAQAYGEYRQSYPLGPASPLRWEWTPHYDGSLTMRIINAASGGSWDVSMQAQKAGEPEEAEEEPDEEPPFYGIGGSL